MAHTKAKGTTKLGRDSESKRLGIKIYGGSPIKCGQIIVRQRGTAYYAGDGVKTGKDDTLYAIRDGSVVFKKIRYGNFNGNKKLKQRVSVHPFIIPKKMREAAVAQSEISPKNQKPKTKSSSKSETKK